VPAFSGSMVTSVRLMGVRSRPLGTISIPIAPAPKKLSRRVWLTWNERPVIKGKGQGEIAAFPANEGTGHSAS
jgi:hypothetical protein